MNRIARHGRWVLAWTLAITCWVVAYRKFIGHPVTLAAHHAWGFPPALTLALGVLEAAAGGLILYRRTAFAGALIFMGFLAGTVLLNGVYGTWAKAILPVVFMLPTGGLMFLTRTQARR